MFNNYQVLNDRLKVGLEKDTQKKQTTKTTRDQNQEGEEINDFFLESN